mmetsp:Transcript_80413/g.126824  ORF Transcript_80413/g.126824 Transcript_80413/m.126824 type:complete len:189 (-) Transcript_80413:20-586(-)
MTECERHDGYVVDSTLPFHESRRTADDESDSDDGHRNLFLRMGCGSMKSLEEGNSRSTTPDEDAASIEDISKASDDETHDTGVSQMTDGLDTGAGVWDWLCYTADDEDGHGEGYKPLGRVPPTDEGDSRRSCCWHSACCRRDDSERESADAEEIEEKPSSMQEKVNGQTTVVSIDEFPEDFSDTIASI